MMYRNGKWPILFFCFNIISEPFSLCVYVSDPSLFPLLSLILFPSDPSLLSVYVCEAAAVNHAVAFPLTRPGLTRSGHHWAKQHPS